MNTQIKAVNTEVSISPAEQKLADEKTYYINSINKLIEKMNLRQEEAAEIMDITQPRVSNIAKSRLEKFTLDFLFLAEEKIKTEFNARKTKKRAA